MVCMSLCFLVCFFVLNVCSFLLKSLLLIFFLNFGFFGVFFSSGGSGGAWSCGFGLLPSMGTGGCLLVVGVHWGLWSR